MNHTVRNMACLAVFAAGYVFGNDESCPDTSVMFFSARPVKEYSFYGTTVGNVAQTGSQTYEEIGQIPLLDGQTSVSYLASYRVRCAWSQQSARYVIKTKNGSTTTDSLFWVRWIQDIRLSGFADSPWVWFLKDTANLASTTPSMQAILVGQAPVRWKVVFSRRDSVIGSGSVAISYLHWEHQDSAQAIQGLLAGFPAEQNGHGYIYRGSLQKLQYEKTQEPPSLTRAKKTKTPAGCAALFSLRGERVRQVAAGQLASCSQITQLRPRALAR